MQNLNKNFNEFSSPCVDNSPKNQEKSVKNLSSDGGMTENASKTSKIAHISGDFDKNSSQSQQNIGVDAKNGESKQILMIKTKPNGRKEIITKYTPDHGWVLHFAYEEIQKGHQCYVVCPAIEEDEAPYRLLCTEYPEAK